MLDITTQSAASESTGFSLMPEREHLVLVRHLARLQQQVTVLIRSHEAQLRHWQRQLMRQSVRLMLERTRADWGLVPCASQAVDPPVTATPSVPGLSQTLASAQTNALICRTGCQMDGDHWREGELCKRDGRVCAVGEGLPTTT